MGLILNIDTATENASVCVSLNGNCLGYKDNHSLKDHASFLHNAIAKIIEDTVGELKAINAFAVTSGPGSYTGLRVGMATAKGLCYALSKPLIAINTLKVMTQAVLENVGELENGSLLCPMLDARRMEVFTALYDEKLAVVLEPKALILDATSFIEYRVNEKIFCFGSGSQKFKTIVRNNNFVFIEEEHSAKQLATLAEQAFENKDFADVSYTEPEYFKDFYTVKPSYLN